ncbi:MAG TPA: DUF2252 domain-containing protein [Stellaceae bacterium]|nr:DUF2252 domain-containing protein [Stellaceae bacterium]
MELLSVEDLFARGKALRVKIPRALHGEWKPDRRADPVRILRTGDAGRLQDLIPIRYGRMLQSPFAFFRGAAAIMAADLAKTPDIGIRVQACGDCHLANFGGFATPERNILFDINDFDETLPGPWEWDLKRLVASVVLAARVNGLTDEQGRDAAAAASAAYRKALCEFAEMSPIEVWYSRITGDDFINNIPKSHRARVRDRVDKALTRGSSEMDYPRLTAMVGGHVAIRDAPPLIFHPEASHAPEFRQLLETIFTAYRENLADDRRTLLDQFRVVDAAIKVVGIGSVGRRCWIALLMSANNGALFLQFKEAAASVLEPYLGKSAYGHHGQRVVIGQRMMQPASDLFLGWVTVETPDGARDFYVRQLRDAKVKPVIESFDAELMSVYAEACGRVLARAHAKTGDQCTISGYLGSSDQFDEAMASFAVAYANQAERDYAALKAAVRRGRILAFRES